MDPLPDFLTRTEYGGIRLTGSRIGLEHVVEHFNDGESPEMIRLRFPHLALPHVYKACAFYLEHRPAVDAYVRAGLERMERLAAAHPGPDWAAMRRRYEVVLAERARAASPAEAAR